MLNEIFRNRKIFNKYIKNFDLDAVELVHTGMTSVEALKAVVDKDPFLQNRKIIDIFILLFCSKL